jgi:hypothetical protein
LVEADKYPHRAPTGEDGIKRRSLREYNLYFERQKKSAEISARVFYLSGSPHSQTETTYNSASAAFKSAFDAELYRAFTDRLNETTDIPDTVELSAEERMQTLEMKMACRDYDSKLRQLERALEWLEKHQYSKITMAQKSRLDALVKNMEAYRQKYSLGPREDFGDQ